MGPRLTSHERLALVLLLISVAAAAAWSWWRIRETGRDNLRSLPPALRLDPDANPK